jgi:hypothetical protein
MNGWMPQILAVWAVRAYPLVLYAYPTEFQRQFGEPMAQLFRDQTRDACARGGLLGLIRLWARTALDLAVGLASAYARERRDAMFRLVAAAVVLYACVLGGTTGYGAIRFSEYYGAPAFSRFAGAPAGEDALYAAYDGALAGQFGLYKTYVTAVGAVLAIWLGVAAALFGVWQASLLRGAALFGLGMAATLVALELLPPVWFPHDVYAPGALWLFGGVPLVGVGVWLTVFTAGRILRARPRAGAA